ncbi:fructuronate reductase [Leifsonia sp. 98AMF]|uniref:mannitol dehydrogenase family protein n=1 Tax=unclassified Leifsonia TaxID=2663824 RepID=UPI00087B8525|nr:MULTISPECIES: mannitol dehydrogenase family protein [unclassified Leifsonia]SDH60896.1 fructuronate reductase [Leifsonia sp. 197AMF]SDI78242.1 fructuronate reductase [Leifsonia sp. 466MF]SDK08142.1 fructuronate reductase [Leifsonia sp. 157MF]SDN81707.1 fructuronate reductase [Leifsonia sp. 509MF]SEN25662.1 fructuronate reductase [Leifsonia sp. 467MF]
MTAASAAPRLTHHALPHPERTPPVRIVHLGLGAFHRSHQAWYTAHAADADQWGIAAFTGRRPGAAELLAAQGCVYTLVERGPEDDRFELIGSIVEASAGDDVPGFVATFASPQVAIVTLTITEAGYRVDATGALDLDDPDVHSDIALLRDMLETHELRAAGAGAGPRTVLGRLLLGLHHRRLADAPPIAIVPCDNLPENGPLIRRALGRLAQEVDPTLADWLPLGTSFVSTSVDRITPRLGPDDRTLVATATGWFDETPVVTEPFADWVLAGDFPSGRPQWETAGARFVDDITPWEARKLWMLNGAHTLLASSGRLRGHATVAEAFTDPVCRAQVDELWEEAARNLPSVETIEYRQALAERFANPRIVHQLDQIAEGSRTKLRLRIVPVALAEREAGHSAVGAATAIAAWTLREAASADLLSTVRELAPELAEDEEFVKTIHDIRSAIEAAWAPEKVGTNR